MKARAQKPGTATYGASPSLPRPGAPFSRPYDVRRLPEGGAHQTVEASVAECEAVAAAIDLPAVAAIKGSFDLRRRAGGRVVVTGRVDAEVSQRCVVTLELFDSRIAQDVDLVFAPAAPEPLGERRRRGDMAEIAVSRTVPGSDDQVDPPDPLVDDVVDLGAIAVEFVALALDPYPRRPGVSFSDVVDPGAAEEPSAFAVLERLKARP